MAIPRKPSRPAGAVPIASPSVRPGWRQMFAALGEPTFRALWLGTLPSTLAMQMGQVALGYVAFRISGSATALGLIAAGWGVPMLLFALVGGVVADRARKRTVLFFTQGTIGTLAAINAALILTDTIQIWHLIAISVFQGTAFAFNMPSRQALIAEITSKENLMNALALNNAGMNLARVLGPTMAGGLIAVSFVGPGGVFLLMAFMYVAAIMLLFRLPPGSSRSSRRPSPFEQLTEGLRYVQHNGVIRMLLMLAFVPILLGQPYIQLMPVFALDVFDVGSQGLGLLMAANGFGALLGSLTIASSTAVRRKGLLQLGLGLTFGISLAIFAFGQSYTIGLLSILAVGFSTASYQTLNSTLIIHNAEPAYHGRVMSLAMMTFAMMPLGSVPLAWLSDQFGAPVTIGVSGTLLALIIAAVALLSPTYRKI